MAVISSLASVSLANPAGTTFPELYAPLWWYSGGDFASSGVVSPTGSYLLPKGGGSAISSSNQATQLFTFTGWKSSTECALEATLWVNSGNTEPAYIELWDITGNVGVSASQISAASTTATVIRSGKFNLTPGHTYGITLWGGQTQNLTDASLIVFPDAPSVSPSVSAISLAGSGGSLAEAYVPLYLYGSGYVQTSVASYYLINKGSTNTTATISPVVSNTLYVLGSTWNENQKFAFEASFYASGFTGYATLWDTTSNMQVSSSEIITNASSMTLVRSGSFSLTPGHSYGVAVKANSTSATYYITKAYLVALGG